MTGASLQLAGLEVCSIFRPIYFNMSLGLFCYILYTVCISFPHEICVFEKTSKFHGEFMSPALFLFEVLKMVKLTRGPLVLYQIPKY